MFLNCLAVGCGGFIGSVCRYLINVFAPATNFPWVTLGINIVSSFIMAFIVSLVLRGVMADGELSLMLRVGFCGGFSTLSAFSVEVVDLLSRGAIIGGIGYAVMTCVLCVSAAALGCVVGKMGA